MSETYAGGCQCGAVRYRFSEKPDGAHVCHCRMCQKAFGSFYASLVSGPAASFEVTRGEIGIFSSSELTDRGFCGRCGTPLTLVDADSDLVYVSIGSFDHPELFPPRQQFGIEARLPYANGIGQLPDRRTTEQEQPERAAAIAASNHQHPDHDTENWPPASQRAMTKERLYLFDTTLRDGAQTAGIEFSLEDKMAVTALIEQLGVDYIEGGYPGANPVDTAFFSEKAHEIGEIHRLRHDQAGGALGEQRSRRAANCCRRRRMPPALSPRPGTIRSSWRSTSRLKENLQSIAETRSRHRARAARKPCSIASTSSTATRPIRNTPSTA